MRVWRSKRSKNEVLDLSKREKNERVALMNRVLRGHLGMMTMDTNMAVARFSYVDDEHVEVTWKIHDYFESDSDFHPAEPMDAYVEFVATLDEAAVIMDYDYPMGRPGIPGNPTNNTYWMHGTSLTPLNILEATNNEITNRSIRLLVSAGNHLVSAMTVLPRTNPGYAMSLLRKQAVSLYRANLKDKAPSNP